MKIKNSILLLLLFLFTAKAYPLYPNQYLINDGALTKEFDPNLKFSFNKKQYLNTKLIEGRIALSNNELVNAMERFTDVLRLAKSLDDSLNTGLAYSFISLTNAKARNYEEALLNALEANSYLSEIGEQDTKMWNLICLGSAYLLNENRELAKRYLEEAVSKSSLANGYTQRYIMYGCENLAEIKMLEGDYRGAEKLLQQTLQYNVNEANNSSGCYYILGRCQMALSEPNKAHKNFQAAYEIAQKHNDNDLLLKIYNQKAKFFKQKGNYKLSSQFFSLADSLSKLVIESRVSQEVQQVTLNYRKEIEVKKAEVLRQKVEIEKLHLHEKSNTLKTTVAFLLFLFTGSLALLMYIRRKTSCKLVRLQTEIVKSNEKQLTNYIAGQEEERNRISRDLHDGIGSQLAILKMQLSQLQKNNNPDSMPKLRESILLCDDIYSGLRNVAFNLMPRTLVKEGLVSAFEELACKLQKSTGLKFYFNNYGIENRLSIEVESALFRISQEITANIIKHSQATVTSIDLAADSNSIGLTISWNGKGFDPKTLENSKGFGWKNINTRLNQMGGSIMIDSSAEQDFSMIMVEVPLETKQRYGKTG
ncbi:MAG: sensor histidine kinase [Tenuifilaceae bacterium]|nr:sensor histidine kinase [Tenuifilaceae bacterium]